MSLYKQIKEEQLKARKVKNTFNTSLLTTLLGEIQTTVAGNLSASQFGILNPPDEVVLKVITKFIKNTKETLRLKPDDVTASLECEVLESFLPPQLTVEELKALVSSYILIAKSEGKPNKSLLGFVMQQMKEGYPNRYDATKVRVLVEHLNV